MDSGSMSEYFLASLPQFPTRKVLITLFTDVKNALEIKEQLLKANTTYNYSFINASLVLTLEQLLASVHKTLLDSTNGKMKSKTENSELILNLSPFTGITDSFKKIGLTDKTENLLAVRFLQEDEDAEKLVESLQSIIEGSLTPVNDEVLANVTDFKTVKKIFKLGQMADDRASLSRVIIALTQLK